ncbi:MAG: hypothetical protein HY978_03930 [Candidatus Liptonbacteria bacterium]|nr:hypothetical protein [Candidatus Liptonbacteria bacterium]
MKNNWTKLAAVWIGCLLLRLLPWRAPNVEPVLAATMPVARRAGAISGFLFAATSMVVYDLIQNRVGPWTWLIAITYGAVGAGAALYLRRQSAGVARARLAEASGVARAYAFYAVGSTLVYDAVTGLMMGPLWFHQPLREAILGQIPFTALHLLGNVAFALTLSPIIDYWLVKPARAKYQFENYSPPKADRPMADNYPNYSKEL